MNPFVKPLLLVALVLVLPLVLLAFVGESYLPWIEQWQTAPPSATTVFVAVTAILATDLFLPVPSGPISTLAGSELGVVGGTFASTLGMTIGSVVAFALARLWGRPLAARFSGSEHLATLEDAATRHGVWLVLLTRPLPVLAEAGVLLVGTLQMSWRSFLPVVLLSNALIGGTYAILGHYASQHDWLAPALCAAIALPVAATYVVRHHLRSKTR